MPTPASPRLRCLSCGATHVVGAPGSMLVRSRSARFAFADCPQCKGPRMMAVAPARERARTPAALEAAVG